jgi:hypothetical protein
MNLLTLFLLVCLVCLMMAYGEEKGLWGKSIARIMQLFAQ